MPHVETTDFLLTVALRALPVILLHLRFMSSFYIRYKDLLSVEVHMYGFLSPASG